MKKLEEFLQKNKPSSRKSRLYEFLPAIESLRDKGYTLNQIQIFLKENDIAVSVAWLSAFMRAHQKQKSGNKLNQATHITAGQVNATQKQSSTVAESRINPLHVLTGKHKEGEFNPVPTAKFEIDNS